MTPLTYDEIIEILSKPPHEAYWYKILFNDMVRTCICKKQGDIYLMTNTENKNKIRHFGLLCEVCVKRGRPYICEKLSEEELIKIKFIWDITRRD